jgi:carbonic anhydrase
LNPIANREAKTMNSAPNASNFHLSRRRLIRAAGLGLGGLGLGVLGAPVALAKSHGTQAQVTPDAAMARLVAGNARFVAGKPLHPHTNSARRDAVAAGQQPFASILACADSRVAPELIFDQGLGDLFVARVAGNVVDDTILASLEYSVIHLGSTLVLVLGHARCGAVQATVEALDGHPSPEDKDTKIGALATLIAPAVEAVPAKTPDRLEKAIELNAANAAAAILANSPPLKARAQAGTLQVRAAIYNLDGGRVTLEA